MVEACSQVKYVGPGTHHTDVILSLFGAHVCGCAGRDVRVAGLVQSLRGPPVNDNGLAVGPEQNVAWLQVEMGNSTIVCVCDRLAGRYEPGKQSPQIRRGQTRCGWSIMVKTINLLRESRAGDEPHDIIRTAVRPLRRAVYRNDPGVVEIRRDFRLMPAAFDCQAIILVGDFLEGDTPPQLAVICKIDPAYPATAVRTDDTIARDVRVIRRVGAQLRKLSSNS